MTKPLFIARQSRHPHGLIGWIVARVMERETFRDNEPAIELLNPAPTDTVLDLGAGHGRSLSLLARYADRGAVIGIDPSEVMVRRARQRNKMAIAAGRVRVEQVASPALPLADASVDKAMTVHTVYFWDSVAEHFTAIARVLKPGGRFVIGFVPAEDAVLTARFPSAVYRFRTVKEIEAQLEKAGLRIDKIRRREGAGNTLVWIAAIKPTPGMSLKST
jgi:ubiquinone/menaquinone biosynthesis C-methylase UbiE